MTKFANFLAATAVAALMSGGSAIAESGDHQKTGASGGHGAKVHWGYSGPKGPENWGELSSAYSLCKTGKHQSPVDITDSKSAGLAKLSFNYQGTGLRVVNNGHTVQVNYGPGSDFTSGHANYQLLQFHFHTPSENAVNGRPYPMEMHLVHKDGDGVLGVVGVFLEEGPENPALQKIWDHLPTEVNRETSIDSVVVNARDLLPPEGSYYRFVGSLTTPPCSEGVQWHVLQEPIKASPAQIKAFMTLIGNNARPVQPLNARLLVKTVH